MPPVRKILIVDPDAATVRALAPALRQRGYQVHAARDGSRALQVAILRFPDLVLLDEKTPLVDPRTFVRILRTNPRTERIPIVVTGETADLDRARLGAFLRKPFNHDEVLARIEQIFRRVDAAKAVSGESREIEGNLAQIPLVDLLQILSVNRKTGRLAVEREGERAEVLLAEGRIADARLGPTAGEKALWRLLTRREGQFAFVPAAPAGGDRPGQPAAEPRITRKLEDLILEGLRQADELARLLPATPAPTDLVELSVAPAEIPAGLHPVTEEVLALLDRPRPFQEVLDRCRASDLEATRAVLALLERGFARRREGTPPPGEALDLLAPHELHALRARIARGRSSGAQTVGKIVVAGGGPLARRAALARFQTVPGFRAEEAFGGPGSGGSGFGASGGFGTFGGFGTLGRLALADGVRVDLTELPGERAQRPLWRPFASGAVGALVLLPADGVDGLLEELAKVLRLPVVVCGPSEAAVPAVLREAPGGFAFHGSDAAEGLRALLAEAGARPVY
jgi:DNA-binding response OmpR family regulator